MRALRLGGWSAIGAGIAGLLALVSVIPWPELFSIEARPMNVIYGQPGLRVVLVGHYAILAAGALLGVIAGICLGWAFRRQPLAVLAWVLVVVGAAIWLYASAAKAFYSMEGLRTTTYSEAVFRGGYFFLPGVALVTLALRRFAGRWFLLLGLAAPVLVGAGVAAFDLGFADLYPDIWGVTFPPPTDYLLALWFIVVGRIATDPTRAEQVQGSPSLRTSDHLLQVLP